MCFWHGHYCNIVCNPEATEPRVEMSLYKINPGAQCSMCVCSGEASPRMCVYAERLRVSVCVGGGLRKIIQTLPTTNHKPAGEYDRKSDMEGKVEKIFKVPQ